MIVTDCSLRCFGGGNSEAIADLAPSGSVEKGFGNYGQIGSGDNETLGDEVSAGFCSCERLRNQEPAAVVVDGLT